MMCSSIFPSRSLALFLCIIFPLYLALRGSGSLSDVTLFLSKLSLRAEALHVALNAPLDIPPPSISKAPVGASARPAKLASESFHPASTSQLDINSFEQYSSLAQGVSQRKYARYNWQTPAQKLMSNKLGYPEHFEKATEGINANARLSEQIAQISRKHYQTGPGALTHEDDADFGLVDLTFGHLSRDWSSHDVTERLATFPPVLAGLEQHFGENGKGKKVLVPGCGMGRLASDIADVAYYSSLCDQMDPSVQPSSRYTALTVPDHMPNKAVKFVQGDFLEMFPEDGQFDAVVTLFFIDIGNNIIDFLSNIHRLLKPGGTWINLGPLKYGTHTALQLSAEEVLHLADLIGFDVDLSSRKSIDSLYAQQPESLLKFTYVTQFWTATKRV
ncbi:methyltransferase-like protein [Colletotrichum phormii]|uniref:Methyltransferase-like protein n=1 Tax=Colletotrichum phormii TaxID=359342 RepID=A0AAI9ZP34_9PEZI|nr:methyltransferase-like protein [Colletotrichum phormii]KAK1634187.1 methyltransferase-like protein [Colletotrichum phormii]